MFLCNHLAFVCICHFKYIERLFFFLEMNMGRLLDIKWNMVYSNCHIHPYIGLNNTLWMFSYQHHVQIIWCSLSVVMIHILYNLTLKPIDSIPSSSALIFSNGVMTFVDMIDCDSKYSHWIRSDLCPTFQRTLTHLMPDIIWAKLQYHQHHTRLWPYPSCRQSIGQQFRIPRLSMILLSFIRAELKIEPPDDERLYEILGYIIFQHNSALNGSMLIEHPFIV